MKKITFFFGILTWFSLSYSQNQQWENYTYFDHITCITEHQGKILAGTTGGIFEIDKNGLISKKTITNSKMYTNKISCFSKDSAGTLLIGTAKGLSYYNCDTAFFKASDHNQCQDSITCIFPYKHKLLIGLPKSLTVKDGSNLKYYRYRAYWQETVEEQFECADIVDESIISCMIEFNGSVYLGLRSGFFSMDDSAKFKPVLNLPNNYVTCSAVNKKRNELWVGTYYQGLAFVTPDSIQTDDQTGKQFLSFSHVNKSIVKRTIKSLLSDNNGTLWAGTDSGLCTFDGVQWSTNYDPDNQLKNANISHLYESSDSSVWVVSGLSLFKFKNGEWNRYNLSPDLPSFSPYNHTFAEDSRGRIWYQNYKVLQFFNSFDLTWHVMNLDEDMYVSQICADKEKHVYVLTNKGLYTISDDNLSPALIKSNEAPAGNLLFCDGQGRLWTGTQKVIYFKEGDSWIKTEPPFNGQSFYSHKQYLLTYLNKDGADYARLASFENGVWKELSIPYTNDTLRWFGIQKIVPDDSGNPLIILSTYNYQTYMANKFHHEIIKYDGNNLISLDKPASSSDSCIKTSNGNICFKNGDWNLVYRTIKTTPIGMVPPDFTDSKGNQFIASEEGMFFYKNSNVIMPVNQSKKLQINNHISIQTLSHSISVSFTSNSTSPKQVTIFDINGRVAAFLKPQFKNGSYRCTWNTGFNNPKKAGCYVVKVIDGKNTSSKKVNLFIR